MTQTIHVSSGSSPSTTPSALPDSVRRSLAPLPETRGKPVVVLEPVTVAVPLPEGFVDIDTLVDEAEQDPGARQAIIEGRKAVARNYYADGPRSLAWYRLARGWSQKELAARVGTSQSYVARLELGEIDPQVSTLRRLAAALELQPSELLDALPAGARRP
jgi:DNA-binding Xre family transcriptional regulator